MISKRILAIDWGRKRIGVAVSDPLCLTAQGLDNLENNPHVFSAISTIARDYDVGEIIIGIPRNLNGTMSESGREVEKFAEQLKATIDIPIVFWDEWMTTAEAERHLIAANKSRAKRKGIIDKVAAQLILQGYLDSRSKNR